MQQALKIEEYPNHELCIGQLGDTGCFFGGYSFFCVFFGGGVQGKPKGHQKGNHQFWRGPLKKPAGVFDLFQMASIRVSGTSFFAEVPARESGLCCIIQSNSSPVHL